MQMEDWRGQLVLGYRIRERLEEDLVGVIYRAFHPIERTDVIFRVLAGRLSQQQDVATQFQELANKLALLEHPGIQQTIRHGTWRDQPFIISKLIIAPTLRQVLDNAKGPMAWADIIQLSRQITSALAFAHQNDVLHLGLRPDNVLIEQLGEKYQAVLKEMGLSRLLELSLQQSYQAESASALAYLSPEQCVASPVSPKTDVYSLGILLYEMVAGQTPFLTPSIQHAVAMHTKAKAKKLSQHRIDVPAEIEELVSSMIEKDPKRRPSMEQIAEKLQNHRRQLRLTHGSTYEALAGSIIPEGPKPARPAEPEKPAGAAPARAPGSMELHITRRGESTRIVQLVKNQKLIIGRGSESDLVLNDTRVSRRHCELAVENNQVTIQDLGSNNGTYMGKIKLIPRQPESLLPGSAIRIPPFTLRLESVAQPEQEQAVVKEEQVPVGIAPGSYVNVSLDNKEVKAIPGSSPGNMQVNLQNLTHIVDHFSVRVFGIPPEWVTRPSKPVQLNPRQQGNVSLTFHPPPLPTTTAGPHPIQIFVHSREQKNVVDQTDAVLIVQPF
ncbi:MAG: protein kinase, partial [Anaerolineales bacterium]|nr:protein kinase [Anaerolineales bacterium]